MPYVERYLFILMSRQLALPELKRYLLHCAQPYRTPKNGTRRGADLKRHEACRNPKYNKAAWGRAALRNISKRCETHRTPKGRGEPHYHKILMKRNNLRRCQCITIQMSIAFNSHMFIPLCFPVSVRFLFIIEFNCYASILCSRPFQEYSKESISFEFVRIDTKHVFICPA